MIVNFALRRPSAFHQDVPLVTMAMIVTRDLNYWTWNSLFSCVLILWDAMQYRIYISSFRRMVLQSFGSMWCGYISLPKSRAQHYSQGPPLSIRALFCMSPPIHDTRRNWGGHPVPISIHRRSHKFQMGESGSRLPSALKQTFSSLFCALVPPPLRHEKIHWRTRGPSGSGKCPYNQTLPVRMSTGGAARANRVHPLSSGSCGSRARVYSRPQWQQSQPDCNHGQASGRSVTACQGRVLDALLAC